MVIPTDKAGPQVEILHLSNVAKCPLVDGAGARLGRVEDLVVRLGAAPYPPVVGAVVHIGSNDLFLPSASIAAIEDGRMQMSGDPVRLRPFERRAGELLLAGDLRAHHLINLVGGRVITANEIALGRVGGVWEVVGVEAGSRSALRRLVPPRLRGTARRRPFIDWASIEPFVAHVPTARLRIPYRKLARLHPAQLADIVEAASHEEGEEIIQAVGEDRELEADVFEELDTEHQLEFIKSRSDAEAARLLGRMAPDDAADLIVELDQERRRPVLELLDEPQRRKVRSLLSYNPETAGGLMSPDFLSMPEATQISGVIEAIRRSGAPAEALNVIFSMSEEGRLSGSVPVVKLLQAPQSAPLGSVVHRDPAHVHPDWDLHSTMRKMSDYNLTVAPVVDDEHEKMLGVVTVDDVLELLLPSGWRREFGMSVPEE